MNPAHHLTHHLRGTTKSPETERYRRAGGIAADIAACYNRHRLFGMGKSG